MDRTIYHTKNSSTQNNHSVLAAASPVSGVDADRWNKFVADHPQAHVLQTAQWGALKGRFGWSDEIVTLADPDGQVCAGALMLFRPLLRFGVARRTVAPLSMAYVPKGPLVDWGDHSTTTELLHRMEAAARQRGAAVLKVEPDLPDTPANRALLQRYGFRPSPQTVQPQSTLVLDIGGSEDEIMQRMKSKWRYNVRLSKRKEVTVRTGTQADMAHFGDLMQITGSRKDFSVHSAAYYQMAHRLFAPQHAAFLFAEYEGQPLATLAVFALGDTAWYLWGASSNRERNRMPNHALQWAAIQWARERGATRYDFWGIPDDVGKVAVGLEPHAETGVPAESLPIDLNETPHNEMWGVYRLKQGFGGNVVRFVGAWDKPLSEPGYSLYRGGFELRSELMLAKTSLRESLEQARPHIVVAAQRLQGGDWVLPRSRGALRAEAVTDAAAWQRVLAAWSHPHVLQSWVWGEVKAQTGWRAERIVLRDGAGDPQAAFQILWRRPVRSLPVQIAYIPKGPLVDWSDATVVRDLLATIEQLTRARRALFVKIDPDVREDMADGQLLLRELGARGWKFSPEQIQFKNTGFTDLLVNDSGNEPGEDVGEDSGEEALLAGMKSKWRYNIRLAGRRGIAVRTGGVDDLSAFYKLYQETSERDEFLIRPFSYYQTVWQNFLRAQDQQAQEQDESSAGGALLLAQHEAEQTPVAGIFLLRYGATTWYFYGASSEARRRDMPNYLLQWEAMRWARSQGCSRYDWWGAPTDLNDEDDRMRGVWRFKEGFGAQFQPHIGAWDWAPVPPLYYVYTWAMPRLLDAMKRLRGG